MTVKITKPEINVREKLAELDYAKVPFQKMPSGSVVQVQQVYQSRVARSATAIVEGNVGINGNIATSSTSWVSTGLTKTINIQEGNKILMQCNIPDINSQTENASVGFKFHIDGEEVNVISSHGGYLAPVNARVNTAAGIFLSKALSGGDHIVDILWRVTSGSAYYLNGHTTSQSEAVLVLQEIVG